MQKSLINYLYPKSKRNGNLGTVDDAGHTQLKLVAASLPLPAWCYQKLYRILTYTSCPGYFHSITAQEFCSYCKSRHCKHSGLSQGISSQV